MTEDNERVEIVRDKWGVAHVFADDEPALFHGVGYASAGDRMFQMMLRRRLVRGRTAEILGRGKRDANIASDRQFRILGYDRHADAVVKRLDDETRAAFEAFANGVNAWLDVAFDGASAGGAMARMFARYGGPPEPWTAADCIVCWDRAASQFGASWQNAARNEKRNAARKGMAGLGASRDDNAAAVTEEEFQRSNPEAYKRLKAMARGRNAADAPSDEGPKMSHNWLVSGEHSVTGKPLLESDPQIPVASPNQFYEIHLHGGRYNARGACLPGSPGMLIGFTSHLAWGLTALNVDGAALYEERPDPNDPGRYMWKGESLAFETREETITVKGGESVAFTVRSTRHGPVVGELMKGVGPGEVYAVQIAATQPDTCTLSAVLEMMRATDWTSFRGAMSGYASPPAHVIYADVHGDIGYQSLAQVPAGGSAASPVRDGWTGDEEWALIPFEEMPSFKNPKNGRVYSANNMPVGAWYPHFLGTGGGGGGGRFWRVHELMERDRAPYSAEDFHREIHEDCVTPPVRDFRTLILALADESGGLEAPWADAVETLRGWDCRMVSTDPAFPLANAILRTMLKDLDATWIMGYGGGITALCAGFNDTMATFRKSGRIPDGPGLREWLMDTLREAVERTKTPIPNMTPDGFIHHMPYQDSGPDGGSLAPEHDLASPPLTCSETHTLWSQHGETYVQIVDLSDLDRSVAFMPPGISENPESPHFSDQMPLWAASRLRPSPLSRKGVEAIKESVTTLRYARKSQE